MLKTSIFILHKSKSYFLGTARLKTEQLILDLSSLGGGEHYTFHKNGEGEIISTHWSNNHPGSVHSERRVDTARLCNYQNPEKHAKYLHHMPLKFSTEKGLAVGSRRIVLSDLKEKTPKGGDQLLGVRDEIIWIDIYFSLNKPTHKHLLVVESKFGWLVVEPRAYSAVA